jgi:hypothetical protein
MELARPDIVTIPKGHRSRFSNLFRILQRWSLDGVTPRGLGNAMPLLSLIETRSITMTRARRSSQPTKKDLFSRERSSTGSNDCFVVVVVVLI